MIYNYLAKVLTGMKSLGIAFFSVIANFLFPIQGLIFLAITLCLMDFLIKIYLVYRKDGRKAITSKKMEDTGFKMLFYSTLLIMLKLVQDLFFKDFGHGLFGLLFSVENTNTIMSLNLASVGAFLIIIREAKSIDENWEQFSGWSFIESITSRASWLFKLKDGTDPKKED
jgi:multisubunit Na+/H+ antiporter MnhC subunit